MMRNCFLYGATSPLKIGCKKIKKLCFLASLFKKQRNKEMGAVMRQAIPSFLAKSSGKSLFITTKDTEKRCE